MPADKPAAAAFSFTATAPAPAAAAPAPAAPAFTFGAAAPAPAPVAAATPAFTFTFAAGAPAPAPAASTPAFTFGAAAPAPAPAAGGPAFTFGARASPAPPAPAPAGGPAFTFGMDSDEEDDEALARRLQREWEEEASTATWDSDEASTELSQLPSDDEEEVAAARHPWADFFHHGNVHVSRLESLYDVNVRVIQSPGDWSARALDRGLTKVEQNPAVMRAVEAVGAKNVASFTSPECELPLLHWAAMAGRVECVRVLLRHGADVEAHRGDGVTPLFFCVPNGEPAVARVLVAAGASIDAENVDGLTPLTSTVQYGQPHLAHVLLSLGARFDMPNVGYVAKVIYLTEQADPDMLDGVIEAHALHKKIRAAGGSYKKYLLATRMPLVVLRRLAASKRAVPRPDCPPIYKRLFPRAAPLDSEEEDETPVRDIIPPPDIPDEVFLRILGFWYTV